MSLPRQDVRFKLNHEVHIKIKVMCELMGVEISDFIESIVVPVVETKCHEAMVLADRLHVAGISGSRRAEPGRTGNEHAGASA
jgi:hypothetical protein